MSLSAPRAVVFGLLCHPLLGTAPCRHPCRDLESWSAPSAFRPHGRSTPHQELSHQTEVLLWLLDKGHMRRTFENIAFAIWHPGPALQTRGSSRMHHEGTLSRPSDVKFQAAIASVGVGKCCGALVVLADGLQDSSQCAASFGSKRVQRVLVTTDPLPWDLHLRRSFQERTPGTP